MAPAAPAAPTSAATRAAHVAYTEAQGAMNKWQSDTSVSSHMPFSRGLGPTPFPSGGGLAASTTDFVAMMAPGGDLNSWQTLAVQPAGAVGGGGGGGGGGGVGAPSAATGGPLLRAMWSRIGNAYNSLTAPGAPLAVAAAPSMYAGGGFIRSSDLAMWTASAADELLALLARLPAPALGEDA
jgi:hypothetical protein